MKTIETENPVNSQTACIELGRPGKPWGHTRMSAIKKQMGIKGRYFLVSNVRRWLAAHPDFRETDVYARRVTPKRQSIRRGRQVEVAGKNGEL